MAHPPDPLSNGEHVELDYATAADAWFDQEITLLMMWLRSEVGRIAAQWREKREEETR